MKLKYIIIYVTNVSETMNFYEKAFSINKKFLHESGMYGEMDTGDTTLSFAANEMAELNGFSIRKNASDSDPAGAEIAFTTDNVEQAFKKALSAGANSLAEPKLKPWGQTVSYVRDLNGFIVEICSPIKA